jgi:formate hydrogenlyase subunit 3/multisubunit Na+/H+ antiporter MnhD subunit
MVVPIVITAILSLVLGIYPDLFFKFFQLAGSITSSILGG